MDFANMSPPFTPTTLFSSTITNMAGTHPYLLLDVCGHCPNIHLLHRLAEAVIEEDLVGSIVVDPSHAGRIHATVRPLRKHIVSGSVLLAKTCNSDIWGVIQSNVQLFFLIIYQPCKFDFY